MTVLLVDTSSRGVYWTCFLFTRSHGVTDRLNDGCVSVGPGLKHGGHSETWRVTQHCFSLGRVTIPSQKNVEGEATYIYELFLHSFTPLHPLLPPEGWKDRKRLAKLTSMMDNTVHPLLTTVAPSAQEGDYSSLQPSGLSNST